MSQILEWLNSNLFGKKDLDLKKISNSNDNQNKTEQSDKSDKVNKPDESVQEENKINKWIPNDALWLKYNKFLQNIGEINRKKHSETKLISQSKHLIKQYKMESVADDITSKMNATQTKQQLMSLESELKRVQTAIKELETMDGKVLDEWNEYIELAREFLVSNGLDTFLDVNDILCSTNLFATMKKIFDSYYSRRNCNEEKLEQIAMMSIYFEPSKTENYSRITDKEFQDKRKELLNKVSCAHIVDDLSKPHDPRNNVQAINDTPTINNNILQISGPTQITIPTAIPISNSNLIQDVPVASITEITESTEPVSIDLTMPIEPTAPRLREIKESNNQID